MNGLPYYKRYPRDFIEATIGWSLDLKGAYGILLDLIYMQGGRLPDDAGYISGLLGCNKHKWASLRLQLIDSGKVQLLDGFFVNSRAITELETTEKYQRKQRENRSTPNKNNDLQSPKLDHSRDYTDTDTDKKKGPPNPPKGDDLFDDGFEEFWKAYPSRSLPHNRKTTRAAWDKAIKNKHKPQDIVAGAKRYHRLMEEDDAIGSPYVAMAATYLNQERWADDQTNGSGYDPECGMSYWDWSQKEKANA